MRALAELYDADLAQIEETKDHTMTSPEHMTKVYGSLSEKFYWWCSCGQRGRRVSHTRTARAGGKKHETDAMALAELYQELTHDPRTTTWNEDVPAGRDLYDTRAELMDARPAGHGWILHQWAKDLPELGVHSVGFTDSYRRYSDHEADAWLTRQGHPRPGSPSYVAMVKFGDAR